MRRRQLNQSQNHPQNHTLKRNIQIKACKIKQNKKLMYINAVIVFNAKEGSVAQNSINWFDRLF